MSIRSGVNALSWAALASDAASRSTSASTSRPPSRYITITSRNVAIVADGIQLCSRDNDCLAATGRSSDTLVLPCRRRARLTPETRRARCFKFTNRERQDVCPVRAHALCPTTDDCPAAEERANVHGARKAPAKTSHTHPPCEPRPGRSHSSGRGGYGRRRGRGARALPPREGATRRALSSTRASARAGASRL